MQLVSTNQSKKKKGREKERVGSSGRDCTYGDIHALLGDSLQASHHVLLHLDELSELLGQIGAESTTGIAAQGMACIRGISVPSIIEGIAQVSRSSAALYVPKLAFPKKRPDLVDEGGGGGLCSAHKD